MPAASVRTLLCAAISAFVGGAPLHAQNPPSRDLLAGSGLQWRSLGPAIAGGRVTDIEALPGRPATVYVGTASGGVFKTVNHGTTWRAIFDGAENLSVGDIAIAPSDSNVIWVGTGEANNRNSSPWGHGIYRSRDGGEHWQFMGLAETRHIGRIVIDPADPDIVYVAALGHLFGPNPERGIYKTADGGRTWQRVEFIDQNTGFVDLAMKPGDSRTLYAAAYQRRRRAYGFVGGGPGSGIYRSTDAGRTWQKLEKGLPSGPQGRIGLAVSALQPDLVLAIVQARHGGIYRSTDGGDTWERINELDPRPMYYSQIRIDPTNTRRIYVLGTQLHRSTDGGKTFQEMHLEDAYGLGVHVDNHALWIDPHDPGHILLGNDGGFYYTFDGGNQWQFAANLPIEQFYDIALDNDTPYHILGGLQDNNSYRGPSATDRWQGILNRDWEVVDYGDGMYAQADTTDARIAYVESQGGAIIGLDTRTGDRRALRPVSPDTSEHYRFDWTAPILISPHDPATIYLGGNALFRSTDRGVHWIATRDLSRGLDRDTLRIMGRRSDSTTLSRNDGTSGYGEITTIAESPVQAGVLWVGTDDGNVQVSRDGGQTWTEVGGRIPGLPHRLYVSRVEASAAEEGRAYVSLDGHWDDDYRPYLFVTDDFGQTWRSLTADLPAGTIFVVREHPRNPDVLFVGAAGGVYYSSDGGTHWERINGNMPPVPVFDLEIQPRENDLVAATHGRGVWVLDDITPLSDGDPAGGDLSIRLFPVRPATLFLYANNVPTLGQGLFRAPNPTYGALLSYSLGAGAPDSVTLLVRDARGQVVRTLRAAGRGGLHRVAWDLRLQPLPMDTSVFPAPSLDVGPRGPLVPPGQYTIELHAGDSTRSAPVEVHLDPRSRVATAEFQERYAFTLRLYELQRIGYFAAVQANILERRAAESVDSLRARQQLADSVAHRADSLLGRIRTAARQLRTQNSALRGWWRGLIGELDGGPSTTGTLHGPTDGQERRYDMLHERFRRVINDLDRVLQVSVPDLNALLQDNGGQTIRVPPRGLAP